MEEKEKLPELPSYLAVMDGTSTTSTLEFATREQVDAYLVDVLDGEYWAVIWAMDGVYFGKVTGNNIDLAGADYPKLFVLELRLFNQREEVQLYFESGSYYGRRLVDGEGEQVKYADYAAWLYGVNENGVLFDKDKKTRLVLPEGLPESKHYNLLTRHYIEVNKETYQAGWGDFRYLDLVPAVD